MKKLILIYLAIFALGACKEDGRSDVSPKPQVTNEQIMNEVNLLLAKYDLKQTDPAGPIPSQTNNSEKIQLFKADFDKLVQKYKLQQSPLRPGSNPLSKPDVTAKEIHTSETYITGICTMIQCNTNCYDDACFVYIWGFNWCTNTITGGLYCSDV
jgi:hypothetical protein